MTFAPGCAGRGGDGGTASRAGATETGGGGGVAAFAGAIFRSPILAKMAPTGTLVPTGAAISKTVPSSKISTSIVALSRSRRRRRCRRASRVARFDQPLDAACRPPCRRRATACGIRPRRPPAPTLPRPRSRPAAAAPPLRGARRRASAPRAADPAQPGVEIVERLLDDARADLGRQAPAAPAFVDDHRALGPRDRREIVAVVERAQHAQVDDLGVDALVARAPSAAPSALRSVPP